MEKQKFIVDYAIERKNNKITGTYQIETPLRDALQIAKQEQKKLKNKILDAKITTTIYKVQ